MPPHGSPVLERNWHKLELNLIGPLPKRTHQSLIVPRVIEEVKGVLPRRREGQADVGGDQVDDEEDNGRDRQSPRDHVEFEKCVWAAV